MDPLHAVATATGCDTSAAGVSTRSRDGTTPEGPPGRLIAERVTVRYGERALFENVQLSIPAGETVAIVGRSGCGKTTLLHVLAGLVVPDAGRVLLDGDDITGRAGLCSLMPQESLLLPWRTLLDNAALTLEIAGAGQADARTRARAWLPRFGLEHQGERYPNEASGGMQQRTALLRCCLHDGPVLLLDEPFGALDALTRRELHGWFRQLVQDLDLAAVLVTHDLSEAMSLASRILVFTLDETPGTGRPEPGLETHHVPCDRAERDALQVRLLSRL